MSAPPRPRAYTLHETPDGTLYLYNAGLQDCPAGVRPSNVYERAVCDALVARLNFSEDTFVIREELLKDPGLSEVDPADLKRLLFMDSYSIYLFFLGARQRP